MMLVMGDWELVYDKAGMWLQAVLGQMSLSFLSFYICDQLEYFNECNEGNFLPLSLSRHIYTNCSG